jgi:hypothetical protein
MAIEGDGQREALRHADQPAGAGDQTPLGLGDAERGVVGRHHQVAREHDLEPSREGRPVDGRDERLGEVTLGDSGETPVGADDGPALARREGLQVHAGGERLVPRTGEDDDPRLGVVGQFVKDRGHCLGHGTVDGVACLGPVDGEDRDVPAPFPQHLVCHGAS